MKTTFSHTAIVLIIFTCFAACEKSGTAETANSVNIADETSPAATNDSISSVATMAVKDKQFIKSAEVSMEVKDVYDATVYIEKSLKDLGGFVTSSDLNSQILSEETFAISDENAMMVRKFQTENTMQVRVPTDQLSDLLLLINNKKMFLTSRSILAEDVTTNIKLAELEAKRNSKSAENIEKLHLDKGKVKMSDDNQQEGNYQKISAFDMQDQLKYSNVDIYLKEPQLRLAEIPVSNTKNRDDQYHYNFIYEAKNAVSEGFYLIQSIILGMLKIWPLIIIGGFIFYILRKRKTPGKVENPTTPQ